jgi:hypothetical protein
MMVQRRRRLPRLTPCRRQSRSPQKEIQIRQRFFADTPLLDRSFDVV